ncbi:adenine-specific methyltransferase EcoRI family protein, partial [Paraprevotella clara]|uniref:adenine-specific methyltransferase EcoRI family protein n=1 Tax=Paraprevotella clara TaxID=454154 RepID=UPI003AB10A46
NLRFSKHKELKGKAAYDRYDNYDAIEVPFTDAIPSDYDGAMGVPISFLIKYCPEQFEILGITKTWYGSASKVYPEQIQVDRHGKETKVTKLNDGAVLLHSEVPQNETYYMVDGKYYTQVYARVLIKHIRS